MPPTTYDDFRRMGAIGPPVGRDPMSEPEQFRKKMFERFEECKIKLNTENLSVVSISHPQDPSSACLPIAFTSSASPYIFCKDYRVYKKPQQKVSDFIAICPFQYKRNYVDNPTKIFNYVEIHTVRQIKVYLYDVEQFNPNGHGIFFDTRYKISEVINCLVLTRAIDLDPREETWGRPLLEQMQENLADKQIPLEDFRVIDRNHNSMFLSTILAYGILAYSMNRFERFRSDTNVPFLLVIDCSSIKKNKNYSDILTYIKRIHEACYMPDGSYGADFPPKSAKGYEEYLSRPNLARRVPLIEADDKFKVEEAFPAFYDKINRSKFVWQKYPYGSLPLIITENGDDYLENYFFKLNAEDIILNEQVQTTLPLVLNTITYITQSACVGLEKRALHPSLFKYADNFELTSIDTSKKRANDKLYLARILVASLYAILHGRESKESIQNMMSNFLCAVLFRTAQYCLENTTNSRASIANNSAVDTLLKCIAEDLKSSDLFDSENPKTKDAYEKVEFAFLYNEMLCFKRAKKDKTVADTFEKYLQKHEILKGGTALDDIWDEFEQEPYQNLTVKNIGNYYKYNVRNGPSGSVYAFKIDTLKEYVLRLS